MTLYDRDIRDPLFDYLEERYGKIRILEEKRTGGARADVVMILPDAIVGIEIKSDADTYARLERQVANYDLYYDRNIIVAGSSHGHHIGDHVPEWWGIITAELDGAGNVDFYVVCEAAPNPRVQDLKKISILWRPELNRLLKRNGLPEYRDKGKGFVQSKLIERVPGEVLWPQACDELFERDYTTIGQEIGAFREGRARRRR